MSLTDTPAEALNAAEAERELEEGDSEEAPTVTNVRLRTERWETSYDSSNV